MRTRGLHLDVRSRADEPVVCNIPNLEGGNEQARDGICLRRTSVRTEWALAPRVRVWLTMRIRSPLNSHVISF